MERGDKINVLVAKTDKLQHDAFIYEKNANHLKKIMWWKNMKMLLILLFLLAILMWIVTSWICGFDLSHCSSKNMKKVVSSNVGKLEEKIKPNVTLHGVESKFHSAVGSTEKLKEKIKPNVTLHGVESKNQTEDGSTEKLKYEIMTNVTLHGVESKIKQGLVL
jgi:hypothetical protein